MNKKYNLKTFAADLVFDFLGCFIYAVAIYGFVKPGGYGAGGLSGIAIILNYLFSLPIGVVTYLLNIPVIILCYRVLGKGFLLRSLKTMAVLTLSLDYIGPLLPQFNGNIMLAPLCSGVLVGIGLTLIFMRGSSTGGGDFIIFTVRKIAPHISIGTICAVFDGFVLVASGVVFGNIEAALYGAVSLFITAKVMDKIMYGSNSGKLLMIVTDKGEDVSKAIYNEVHRGSTIADIRGSYKGEKRQLVISAVSKSQLFKARKVAHAADENSFTMITPTDEVFGLGFADPRGD